MTSSRQWNDCARDVFVNGWAFFLAALALGLAIRAWVILHIPLEPEFDFKRYFDAAASLVENGTLANAGHPYIIQGPGYPLLLASVFSIFGIGVLQGKILNLFLYLGSMLLVELSAQKLGLSRTTRLLTTLFIALHPGLVLYVNVLGTEYLSVLLVLACLFFGLQDGKASLVALGVSAAALSLTRPQYLPVIFLFVLFAGGNLASLARRAMLCLLPFLLVMAPWAARNYQTFNTFVPVSASAGYISLVNNNDAANGFWMPLSQLPLSEADKQKFDQANNPGLFEVGNEGEKVIRWSPANDQIARTIAVEWMKSHPTQFLGLAMERLEISFFSHGGNMLFWPLQAVGLSDWLFQIVRWVNLLTFALATVSLAMMTYNRRQYFRAGLIPTLIVLGGVGAIFVFEGQGRYVIPMLPAALVLATLPLATSLRRRA